MSQAAAAIIVAAALSRIGKPYQWGATGPDAFDCSGLVVWSYSRAGIDVPRTSEAQALGGAPVDRNELEPGDIVIYYPDASHVALYVGEGNIVQASTPGTSVAEVPIDLGGPYNQARRYLKTEDTVTLYGVDVSNNNWTSVEECQSFIASLGAQGYSWVEAKVSEGNYYSDPFWPATLQACQSASLPVIGYHYANASSDPASQVQTFIGNHGGNVVMIDFEANSGDINDFWNLVNAFNAAGVDVALSYIPQWYWQQIGSPDLSQVPGLISSSYYESGTFGSIEYSDAGGDTGPGWTPYGGATPIIWQFTDGDIVAGKSVDGNAFKGSLAQLQALLTGATPVTQPDPTLAVVQDNQVQLRGPGLNGWPQLGGHTVVDALAVIGQKLGIDGFTSPGSST